MLPQAICEKTIFIGNSTGISSMLGDWLSNRNREIIRETFLKDPPTGVYLQNFHLLNSFIAKLSRKNGGRFIYHVHEPFVKNKKAHGGFHQYWLHLFEYFQEKLLNDTDIAVVSSKEASSLFSLRYRHFSGRKMLIPLLYEDLSESKTNADNRTYVTFVGPPVPAKNPEKFLDIVQQSSNRNLPLKFLLLSRIKLRDKKYFNKSNMDVSKPVLLTDEEFGNFMKKSIAVLTPYARETQSSVILVSYMYGTPVVSSDVGGLPEFVQEGVTGYCLSLNDDSAKWIDLLLRVKTNFPKLSSNCREYFVNNFSGKNWQKYLNELLIS